MRVIRLALACTLVLAAAAAQAQEEDRASNPSLDRMRSVLQRKPLRLTTVEPEPTFKIEIHAIHPMHEIFEKPVWQLDPIGWQPPRLGFDMMNIVRMAAGVKRAYDTRVAREQVHRAIAEYCAAQPNAGTIQICSTSPAIR